MAFSSKARSAYTQLMLTHIDANGNASPAIIVDNTTPANRGVYLLATALSLSDHEHEAAEE